jgi:hypothetical protein
MVGSRAQVGRQPPRRREQVVQGQAEGASQRRYQVVWRRVLTFALDARQVGDGDSHPPRQIGQRHLPSFARTAEIMSKRHVIVPWLSPLHAKPSKSGLCGHFVHYMFS